MLKRLLTNPFSLAATILAIGFMVAGSARAAGTVGDFTIKQSTNSNQSSLTAPAPGYTDALVLTANVALAQVVPAGASWVVFSFPCTYYANAFAAATVPASTTTDGSASQQSPAAWLLPRGIYSISIISGTSCTGTMSFYR